MVELDCGRFRANFGRPLLISFGPIRTSSGHSLVDSAPSLVDYQQTWIDAGPSPPEIFDFGPASVGRPELGGLRPTSADSGRHVSPMWAHLARLPPPNSFGFGPKLDPASAELGGVPPERVRFVQASARISEKLRRGPECDLLTPVGAAAPDDGCRIGAAGRLCHRGRRGARRGA